MNLYSNSKILHNGTKVLLRNNTVDMYTEDELYRNFRNGDTSAYDELMQELDEYIPFWTTAEFREEMFPDS